MRKLLFFVCLMASVLIAEEPKEAKIDLKEEIVETHGKAKIAGQDISYTVYTGTLPLFDNNKPKASIFFIAYFKDGVEKPSERPITFCFNGGPGSSSVWLHMGCFGPKRVEYNSDAKIVAPYELKDNEYSLLDKTDLVFIDPISTGFSKTVDGEDPKQYYEYDEDIKSVAEFIRYFTSKYKRWESPKFLAGESYGTTRAAGLALRLHDNDFFYLNGLILVSSVLNFQTIRDAGGNDLPFILLLPTYTSTAWYHHKLSDSLQKDLQESINQSEEFAMGEYATALLKGDLLSIGEKKEIAVKMAALTGLSEEYILNSNLRVPATRYMKELLRKDKRIIGRFDSRFIGIEADHCCSLASEDPSLDAIAGAFAATQNQYLRTTLKWDKPVPYTVIANISEWSFNRAKNSFLNAGDDLKSVMNKNPDLKVYVACGAYDLATPYFGTEYTFNHLDLDPSLKSNVDIKYYEAGHMMYLHIPSLIKMKKDLSDFFKEAQ